MAHPEMTDSDQGLSLEQRRAFMRLPLKERRRLMAEQAERMVEHYESQAEVGEREIWQGYSTVHSTTRRSVP